MLRLRCPTTSTTLPLHYRYKPQCKGSHKTNELLLADSIALTTCIQKPCLCAATPIQRLCRMLMFSVIFVSRRRRCSLLPVEGLSAAAVTCNESPALSIMSAQLDKNLLPSAYLSHHLKHSEGGKKRKREKRKEKASSLLSASAQPQPRQTIPSPPPPALAFLLARRE